MNPRNLPILFASLAALLGSLSAEAQTTKSLTLTFPNGAALQAVNRQDCLDKADKIRVTWNFPNGITNNTNLTIFLSDSGSCPDTPTTTAQIVLTKTTITQTNVTGTASFTADKLSPDPDKPDNCPADRTKHWLVCAVANQIVTDSFGSTTERVLDKESLPVDYDSQPPQAPVLNPPSAGDGTIYLSWTEAETVDKFVITYQAIGPAPGQGRNPCEVGAPSGEDAGEVPPPEGTDGGGKINTKDINNGTVRSASVSGLTNEQLYQLFIVAVDLAGNTSEKSNVVTATPKMVQDFYTRYRCAGGSEEGGFGCSAAGPALVPIAGLAALALLRLGGRRKE